MKIQDIRIGQVFYDNNGVKHTVTKNPARKPTV